MSFKSHSQPQALQKANQTVAFKLYTSTHTHTKLKMLLQNVTGKEASMTYDDLLEIKQVRFG